MMINHEKILKRPDGSRVKIVVHFIGMSISEFVYETHVLTCPPKKRTFADPFVRGYGFRILSKHEREEFIKREQLKYVTEFEILEAKRELWKKMEPK